MVEEVTCLEKDGSIGVMNEVCMMRGFKKGQGQNLVSLLLRSYLLMIVIPIAIIGVSACYSFTKINADIKEANISKLEHSVELIETNLLALNRMAQQAVSAKAVRGVTSIEEVEVSNILQYKHGIDELATILKYQKQGVGFIDKFFLYMNSVDYCFFENSLYNYHFFESYLEKWGIEEAEWRDKLVNPTIDEAGFVKTQSGKLFFISPIEYRNGTNRGMMVFMIDEEELLKYFSFQQEYGDSILYAVDKSGTIMVSKNEEETLEIDFSQDTIEEIFPNYPSNRILKCEVPSNQWTYYVLLPKHMIGNELIKFWILEAVLIVFTLFVCLLLAKYQANKVGKPMDTIYDLVTDNEDTVKSTEKLGQIVAGIVNSNLEMQKELEESKPVMQKAFFHDLITLDVTSTKELQYLADSVGISLGEDKFWVASARLFSNNDVYDIDEQTIEDVRVIIRAMQKHIEEQMQGKVWFFQRNYLSLLVLFQGEQKQQVLSLIQETDRWLLDLFSTESQWGISSQCDDIKNVWKYAEEAEIAARYCDNQQHYLEYSNQIDDRQTFYFPELAQDKLKIYLRAGDFDGVKDMIEILYRENVQHRNIRRKGYIKLNTKICELLSELESFNAQAMQGIMILNQTIVEHTGELKEVYFQALKQVCQELCDVQEDMKGAQRNMLIENIKSYLEANFANSDLGLAMVSVQFGVSEGYISSLFKEETQIGFAEYIEKLRMNKAVELLKSDATVEDIAARVGYNSVQSFRRAFKRVFDTSPKSYRQVS